MFKRYFATALLALALIAGNPEMSFSQSTGGAPTGSGLNSVGDHTCGGHSADFHQHPKDGYILAWWKMNQWIPHHVYSVQTTKDNSNPTFFLGSDSTSNSSCESINLNQKLKISETLTHSVDVGWDASVGGEVSWAAGSLFAKCKASVNAQVSRNSNHSDTKEIKIEKELMADVPKCIKLTANMYVQRNDKKMEMDYASARFQCHDTHANKYEWWDCNRQVLTADGLGHKNTHTVIETTKICDCGGGVTEQDGEVTDLP